MAERRKARRRFAVCVCNEGYEASLRRNKIYLVRPDPQAEKDGFVVVEVPRAVQASLVKAGGRSRTKTTGSQTGPENLAVSNDPEFRALIERSRRLYPAGSGLTTAEVQRRLRSTRRPGRGSSR